MDSTHDFEEIKWAEIESALTDLCLKWMTIGDYLVVVNDKCDVTIGGEPYLALQLWFNVKTGKIINRIWGQTVSSGKVARVSQFVEACNSHLNGRPCLGCPLPIDEHSRQNYFISHTPMPRKISRTCKKLLDPGTDKTDKSCSDCQKLSDSENETVASHDSKVCLSEKFLLVDPTQALEQGDFVKTLSENDFNNAERRNFGDHGETREKETNFPISEQVMFMTDQETSSSEILFEDAVQNSNLFQKGIDTQLIDNKQDYSQINYLFPEEVDTEVIDNKQDYSQITSAPHQDTKDNTVQDIKKFKCSKCEFSTFKCSTLKRHIKGLHDKVKDFKCPKCNFTSSRNSIIVVHMKRDHKNKCPKCDYAALSKGNLELHMKNYHGTDIKKKCPRCDFATELKSHLLLHMKSDHGIKVDVPESFNCEICEKVCQNRDALERHKASDHGGGPLHKKCEVCGKAIKCNKASFSRHMRRAHGMEGKYDMPCYWCKEKFSTVYIYEHVMQKHFYGNFSCEHCSFSGHFARDLVDHVNENHEGVTSVKCPRCKKDHPIEHLEAQYKNCINEYYRSDQICASCGKTLKGKDNLKTHKKFHCSEQPPVHKFFCDKCGRNFSSPHYLKVHIQSVHEDFVFKCKVCPKTFTSSGMMYDHEIIAHSTDTKYQCRFCGIRRKSVAQIKIHELVHQDPKFECKVCGKKLKTQQALDWHERQHSGEKPYKCSVCENGFASIGGLRQHEKGVHKIVGRQGGPPGWFNSKTKRRN